MKKTNKSKKIFLRTKHGFSLVELIITLFIFAIGLAAVVFMTSKNIKSSVDAKDQIVASELAQEGIELIRNLKDRKNLDVSPYDHACSTNCQNLRVDINSNIPAASSRRLNLNGNFYTHSTTGSPTRFFRRIDITITGNISPSPSNRVMTVKSYVTWNNVGFSATNLTASPGFPATCTIANKCLVITSTMNDYDS